MPKASVTRKNDNRSSPVVRKKDPKASHLYTDDNPSTTIHGTGFKDEAAAWKTLDLIKDRSLTYQFQTVNTMFYRAKHHPSMKGPRTGKNADMHKAMAIFKEWLDTTYPGAKSSLRYDGFKPLLSKACVERYIPQLKELEGYDHSFACVYAKLGKAKRLGNVLIDHSKPMEADWERKRYEELAKLVPKEKEKSSDWDKSELYEENGVPSNLHLRYIGWAWSPLGERRLKK